MAGFGKVPDLRPVPPRRPAIKPLEADVVIVGAGPSGLAAAVAAAEGAARVVLVEEADRAGGSLLLRRDEIPLADEMVSRFADAGGVFLPRSVAFGVYGTDGHGDALPAPGLVAIQTPERIHECSPRALVVASGYHETPPLFPGNDLPGVMGARAALILLHRHGILAGRRIAIAGAAGLGSRAGDDLSKAGAEVVGVAGHGGWEGAHIAEARGGNHVSSIVLSKGEERWSEEVDCVLSVGNTTPRIELLQQAGARLAPSGWALAPHVEGAQTSVPSVFACGSVLGGDAPVAQRIRQGQAAGEAATRFSRGGAR